MKFRSVVILFGLVAIALAIALVQSNQQAKILHTERTNSLLELSIQLSTAVAALEKFRQINSGLTNVLMSMSQNLEAGSNDLTGAVGRLTRAKGDFAVGESQVRHLGNLVDDLQSENPGLNARAGSLAKNYASLTGQLDGVQQQLLLSESNNVLLALKLQQTLSQKSEWQRRFNDFSEVRNQYFYLAYGFY